MTSGQGGPRPGAGRPKGAISRAAKDAIERAKATGELPHEFLLRVSRGEAIDGKKPKVNERIDAAKAAAPYFAPKLTYSETETGKPGEFGDLDKLTDEERQRLKVEIGRRSQARSIRLGLGKVVKGKVLKFPASRDRSG